MLSTVGEDCTAWHLRAQRLIGPKASFPVGPREDFDWPTACLEIEKLITYWTGDAQHEARQTQAKKEERQRVRLQRRGPVEEEQEVAGGEELQGVGVAAQEVAYAADEGIEVVLEAEDGEMLPDQDGDQLARLRIALEDRLGGGVGELMEDGRMALNANGGQDAGLLDQNDFMDPDIEVEEFVIQQVARCPEPPRALRSTLLPTKHISTVNSVLLLGREGGTCATASRDWNVKLWDLQANNAPLYTLKRQGDFSSHRGWVWCLASKGSLLASGGFDSTVRLWDLQAGGADRGLIKTGAAAICLSWQPDVLLAGTFDKRISMYDTRGEGL